MNKDEKELLSEGINTIVNSLFYSDRLEINIDKALAALEIYFDQIIYYNPIYKLVKADNREIIIRHFLDSIAPFEHIFQILFNEKYNHQKYKIADFGSGAGFPGLVLSALFLNVKNTEVNSFLKPSFYLVERMGRRAGFLRTCLVLTGLSESVSVIEKDTSELNDKFDVITMRAFRPLSEIYSDLIRTTKKGSKVIMYKTSMRGITDEISKINISEFSTRVVSYTVPYLNAERTLLILSRL